MDRPVVPLIDFDRIDFFGGEGPRPARVDTPGPKLCPDVAPIKQRTTRSQVSCFVDYHDLFWTGLVCEP